MSNCTNAILSEQVGILRDFLYHYVTYKELIRNYEFLNGSNIFWKFTIDAHLMKAADNWCMVYGVWWV